MRVDAHATCPDGDRDGSMELVLSSMFLWDHTRVTVLSWQYCYPLDHLESLQLTVCFASA